MKVKALRLGFYEHKRRREGEIFNIREEKEFSSKWMEKVEPKAQKKGKAAKADELAEDDDSSDVI